MEETKTTTAEITQANGTSNDQKFCSQCGKSISAKAVICPFCGCQVGEMKKEEQPQIIINNTNQNQNQNNNVGLPGVKAKSKWVALLLCFFLGAVGAHKFYEGKIGMGILYLFTGGLFGIGVLVNFISLLFKPNPYYVT